MRRTVEASTYIKAPRSLVFSLLTAYEDYRRWVPDIVESRLFAREADVAIAEFISPGYGSEKFVVEFVESPDETVVYEQVDRFREQGLAGRWELAEAGGGESVVVRGVLSLRAGLQAVWARRSLLGALQRTLEALRERAQLQVATRARAATSRRLILELVQRPDEVVARLEGKEFRLALVAADAER